MELHWEHGFSPILQSPKTSGGLGKVSAEDSKGEAGSRSEEQFPVARLCSGRGAGRGDVGLGSPPGRQGLIGRTVFSAGISSHPSITVSSFTSFTVLLSPLLLFQPKPSYDSMEAFPIEGIQVIFPGYRNQAGNGNSAASCAEKKKKLAM